MRTDLLKKLTAVMTLLAPMLLLETSAAAESNPTVSIVSPASGTVQKGKVTIIGLATPDPSGTANLIERFDSYLEQLQNKRK